MIRVELRYFLLKRNAAFPIELFKTEYNFISRKFRHLINKCVN